MHRDPVDLIIRKKSNIKKLKRKGKFLDKMEERRQERMRKN